MRLGNAILRPGKVIEVLDNGKIRASVPGLFSEEYKDKLRKEEEKRQKKMIL